MFVATKPHKKFVASTGEELEPVVTLKDTESSSICHIAVDDESYVVYLRTNMLDGFFLTPYIFPEVHKALVALPPPNNATQD